MNKLKPEDVMRALECCNTKGNCNQCPYEIVAEYTPCYSVLTQDALALLREKDARIEELEEAQGAEFTCFVGEPHKVDRCPYGDELVKKDAEIERLSHQCSECAGCTQWKCDCSNIRVEAISEFAERMEKALTAQVNVSSNEMLAAFMWCLDLVKNVENQLKGETDGKGDL